LPVSVAKFILPRSISFKEHERTQAVRKIECAPEIGAQIFRDSHHYYVIVCFMKVKIFGTHPAE
jgi:hypothetical protein